MTDQIRELREAYENARAAATDAAYAYYTADADDYYAAKAALDAAFAFRADARDAYAALEAAEKEMTDE